MAEGEEPPKGGARSEREPLQGFARTDEEPPKGGVRADGELPKGGARGGSEGVFGGGLGWAIVAFIGPVGLDVSQLAARMLRGGAQGDGSSVRQQPLGDLARIQREARIEIEARERQLATPSRQLLKKSAPAAKPSQRVRKGGGPPKYPK